MSLLNKSAFAVAICLATGAGFAGIKEVTMKTEPTKVPTMARVDKDSANSGTFSCYQEGRLIFQSKNLGNSTKTKGDEASLVLMDKRKSISLMDFKNGLCIFEQAHDKTDAKKDAKKNAK